jgi:hypothetical protein
MAQEPTKIGRRHAVSMLLASATCLVAPNAVAQARLHDMHVSRDAGCGCCATWVDLMRRSGRFRVTLTNEADMAAVKRRLGVPSDLASCHTAMVAGFAVEGHVPAPDILRLIETSPRGVRGIAVAGMPIGSPGMEQAGMGRDAFEVVAFGADGARHVFARYAARS